jgi:hypothetical protein
MGAVAARGRREAAVLPASPQYLAGLRGGRLASREPIIVRAGEAFIAIPEQVA